MKKSAGVFLIGLAIVLSSCNIYFPMVKGSGNITERFVDVGNFTHVAIESNVKATIRYGSTCGIVIRADDNLIESYVGVFKDNDTVRITLDPTAWYQDITVEAVVTLPGLSGICASGNSSVIVKTDPVLFGNLNIEAYDNASVDAEVTVDTLDLTAWGNSRISYSGAVSKLNVDSRDNSTVNQSGSLNTAYVTGSGNSRVILNASYIAMVSVDLSDNCMMDIVSANTVTGSLEDNAWLNYSGTIRYNYAHTRDNAGIGWRWWF